MTTTSVTPIELDLSYHGPALVDGQMNVRDLAPAMLSVGSLFESANELLNGESATVNISVRATSSGSFHILFEILQNLGIETIGDVISTAADMKELLFGGGGLATLGIGLFRLIKWLKGRNPTIERVNEGMFRLTVDNETYDVPTELLRMYQDGKVRNSIAGVIRPVKEDGIETFEIRDSNEVIESVTKDEIGYFDAPEVQQPILDEVRTHGFSIVSLAFKEGNRWRLTDGQATFSVSMKDTDFQDRVDNNEVAFAKNDVLVCDMRTMQWQTMQGIKTEYEIVKVQRHLPARQLRLPGMDSFGDEDVQ